MPRFVPILFLLSLVVPGCNWSEVQSSDLIGTWVITGASRQRLATAFRDASAKIVLNENGSFSAYELPGEALYVKPNQRTRLVTGNGVWKLERQKSQQQVILEFRAITNGGKGNTPYGTQLYVSRDNSGITLFYFQGDPDEGLRMKFEKK